MSKGTMFIMAVFIWFPAAHAVVQFVKWLRR